MSDLQILLDEETTLVFEVEVQGASTKNLKSRFIIETNEGMDLSFDGKLDNTSLSVKMPILALTLEPNTYKCRLEMILEGEKFSTPLETTIDTILPVKTRVGIKGNKVHQKKQVKGTVIVKDDVTIEERIPAVPVIDEVKEVKEVKEVLPETKVKIYDEKNQLVEIETKNHQFELKALGDDGTFEGYGSIFGNVDSYGDIVVKGAFEKTLKERKNVKLLWQHDTREPIGVFTEMFEDTTGLVVKGQIAMDVQKGKEAYALLKMGAIDGLSIGYKTIRSKIDKKSNSRLLTELKLFEVSVVTFPANEVSTVTAVKSEMDALTSADEIAVLDFVKSLQTKDAPIDTDHPSTDADKNSDTPIEDNHLLQQLMKELNAK